MHVNQNTGQSVPLGANMRRSGLGWFDWSMVEKHADILRFATFLIRATAAPRIRVREAAFNPQPDASDGEVLLAWRKA